MKKVNKGVYVEIFLLYIYVCKIPKRYESLEKTFILKCSFVVGCVEPNMPVYEQVSLKHYMLCIILCHV